jgi:hypothetical protein
MRLQNELPASKVREIAMSSSSKVVAIVAAIFLGVLAWQVLPGGAEDKAGPAVDKPAGPAAEPPPAAEKRGPSAGRRSADLPLQHAILRDEKDDDSAEAQIIRTLAKPTTVEFLDLPLEDCITFIKEYHKLNIWIHKSAMADEGVALDQPMTLNLAAVSLESVLHLLFEPVQLDWVIQDEVLKVVPLSWANKHPETRTYDVHNLIAAGHKPEELIASITKCVEPASWSGKDATAGISHTGGVLVIRQSQRVHSDIAHLLEDLDIIAEKNEDAECDKEAKTASLTIGRFH